LVVSQQPLKHPTANKQNTAWGLISDTLMLEKDGNETLFSVPLKARAVWTQFLQFMMMAKSTKIRISFKVVWIVKSIVIILNREAYKTHSKTTTTSTKMSSLAAKQQNLAAANRQFFKV
jgi:hypothetical protein